jgi:Mg2+-importing ATPase
MTPADVRIIASKDLFLNQSALTGESFPIEKFSEPAEPKSAGLADLTNIAFMGSSVASGSGQAIVLKTGMATHFGEISSRLTGQRPQTSFEKGVNAFTWLMIRLMLVMVVITAAGILIPLSPYPLWAGISDLFNHRRGIGRPWRLFCLAICF